MRGALSQNLGENFVGGGYPGARVDHKQTDIGHIHRPFGQAPHPALQAFIGGLFQTCGINHCKAQIPEPRCALTQIACHTGLVINQGKPFSDQPVEQR